MPLTIRLKDIFEEREAEVFRVVRVSQHYPLDWEVELLPGELLPDEEGIYFVAALQVFPGKIVSCFLGITIPERVADMVLKMDGTTVRIENFSDQPASVIPAVACECFGNYQLFYAKEDPQVGIDVLNAGLLRAKNKHVVAEDLGYILRDEKKVSEAILAFEISVQNGPSSAQIYAELADLYQQAGNREKHLLYAKKFEAHQNSNGTHGL